MTIALGRSVFRIADGFFRAGASDAHGQIAELRNGNRRRFVRWGRDALAAREEDRRAPGIGGRRHPGIDPDVGDFACWLRQVEGVREQPRPVGIGIGESDAGDQNRQRPQRERVVAGNVGTRQARVEGTDHPRHARLMFAPQRLAEGAAGCRNVVLNTDRLVGKGVALFQHPIGIDVPRQSQPGQRNEGGDEGDEKAQKQGGMQPKRSNAEEAEPGGRQKQEHDRSGNEGARQNLLGDQHRPRDKPFQRQRSGKRLRLWRFILPELRHPPKFPFGRS